MKKLLLLMCGLFIGFVANAQTLVSGTVVDEAGTPVIGASVFVPETTMGTSTDVDGTFSFSVQGTVKQIQVTCINYRTETIEANITGAKYNLGTIKLVAEALAMEDVVITQSVAVSRKTPVAVSTINLEELEFKIGGMEFPEVLKSTPGVYATKDGGGYGDSKINMRGFKSANVAVMINGVPVNDMEWGGVYWSNWAGLSDVTRSMQTQRGMGASKISSPTVGGTINIVTNSIDAKKGGTASYGIGNDGANTMSFSLSTGLNDKGWAMSVLLQSVGVTVTSRVPVTRLTTGLQISQSVSTLSTSSHSQPLAHLRPTTSVSRSMQVFQSMSGIRLPSGWVRRTSTVTMPFTVLTTTVRSALLW